MLRRCAPASRRLLAAPAPRGAPAPRAPRTLVPVARVGECARRELRAVLLRLRRLPRPRGASRSRARTPSRTAARGGRRPAASPSWRTAMHLLPRRRRTAAPGARRRRRRLRHRVLRRFPRQRPSPEQRRVDGVAFALRRRQPARQLLHRPRPVDVGAPAVRRAAARHGERDARARGPRAKGRSFSRSVLGSRVRRWLRSAALLFDWRSSSSSCAMRAALSRFTCAPCCSRRARSSRSCTRNFSSVAVSAACSRTARAVAQPRAPPPPRRAATARGGGSRRTRARAPRRRSSAPRGSRAPRRPPRARPAAGAGARTARARARRSPSAGPRRTRRAGGTPRARPPSRAQSPSGTRGARECARSFSSLSVARWSETEASAASRSAAWRSAIAIACCVCSARSGARRRARSSDIAWSRSPAVRFSRRSASASSSRVVLSCFTSAMCSCVSANSNAEAVELLARLALLLGEHLVLLVQHLEPLLQLRQLERARALRRRVRAERRLAPRHRLVRLLQLEPQLVLLLLPACTADSCLLRARDADAAARSSSAIRWSYAATSGGRSARLKTQGAAAAASPSVATRGLPRELGVEPLRAVPQEVDVVGRRRHNCAVRAARSSLNCAGALRAADLRTARSSLTATESVTRKVALASSDQPTLLCRGSRIARWDARTSPVRGAWPKIRREGCPKNPDTWTFNPTYAPRRGGTVQAHDCGRTARGRTGTRRGAAAARRARPAGADAARGERHRQEVEVQEGRAGARTASARGRQDVRRAAEHVRARARRLVHAGGGERGRRRVHLCAARHRRRLPRPRALRRRRRRWRR